MGLNCGVGHVYINKQGRRGKGRKAPPYRTIHGVADQLKPDIKAIVVGAVVDVRNETSSRVLSQLIRANNVQGVLDAIPFNDLERKLSGIGGIISLATTRGAENSIKHITEPLQVAINFNVNDPRIINYISSRTGELSNILTEENKRAISNILLRAIDQEIPPLQSAEYIKSVIGLTERQAVAVDNFRNKLIEEGVDERIALARANAKAEQFIDLRAETIARTETIRGANFGQLELGNQIQEQTGLVLRKRWIVTPDDRLCPVCESLDNVMVDIGEEFVAENGNRVQSPPIHPNCRCSFEFVPQ